MTELQLGWWDFFVFFHFFRGRRTSFHIHSSLLSFSVSSFCLVLAVPCASVQRVLVQEFHGFCSPTEWCVNFPRGNVVMFYVPSFACQKLDCNNNKLIVEVHHKVKPAIILCLYVILFLSSSIVYSRLHCRGRVDDFRFLDCSSTFYFVLVEFDCAFFISY